MKNITNTDSKACTPQVFGTQEEAETNVVLLHHFTTLHYLQAILAEGLRADPKAVLLASMSPPKDPFHRAYGFIPEAFGVWLTENPHPSGQQWACGSIYNKKEVRLDIEIPVSDSALIGWRDLAERLKLSRQAYRILDQSGDYGAKHWWVYQGIIPSEWIRGIHLTEAEIIPIGDEFLLVA